MPSRQLLQKTVEPKNPSSEEILQNRNKENTSLKFMVIILVFLLKFMVIIWKLIVFSSR